LADVERPGPPREVEGKLLLSSASAADTHARLVALRSVGSHTLVPEDPLRVNDAYLDLVGGELGRQRIGLRLRRSDGGVRLTLKADSHDTSTVSDRLEIEAPWGRGVVDDVFAELSRHGIAVPRPASVDGRDPLDILAGAGFAPVQVRELSRIPRAVVRTSGGLEPVAEMAIDTVTYHLDGEDLSLREVEVEAKGPGGLDVVEEVTAALLAAFPGQLRRWSHGKFPTGEALRDLHASGDLAGLLDGSGGLHPPAYDIVDSHLDPTQDDA
jgi:inorganic triphosphatase YgiF